MKNYNKTRILFILVLITFFIESCIVINNRSSNWIGTLHKNDTLSHIVNNDPSVIVYLARKPKGFIIPFFSFEWDKEDYGLSFSFATENENIKRIDSVSYKLGSTDGLLSSGVARAMEQRGIFMSVSAKGIEYTSKRRYALLETEHNIKLPVVNEYNVELKVYSTNI